MANFGDIKDYKLENQELIDDIVRTEWQLFQGVNSMGGRASCQDDEKTFWIMRRSNYSAMPIKLLSKIFINLKINQMKDVNVIANKYAYMMESTDPVSYALIKDRLPVVTPEKEQLIDEITTIYINYQKAIREEFPEIVENGRPLYATSDSTETTSIETYFRGELKTYPMDLLEDYKKFLEEKNPLYHEFKVMLMETILQG